MGLMFTSVVRRVLAGQTGVNRFNSLLDCRASVYYHGDGTERIAESQYMSMSRRWGGIRPPGPSEEVATFRPERTRRVPNPRPARGKASRSSCTGAMVIHHGRNAVRPGRSQAVEPSGIWQIGAVRSTEELQRRGESGRRRRGPLGPIWAFGCPVRVGRGSGGRRRRGGRLLGVRWRASGRGGSGAWSAWGAWGARSTRVAAVLELRTSRAAEGWRRFPRRPASRRAAVVGVWCCATSGLAWW